MGRKLTVFIDGREAVPVRAIPFVCQRGYSPDAVARMLTCADELDIRLHRTMTAYHVVDGKSVKILARCWNADFHKIEALEFRLKREFPSETAKTNPEGFAAWIDEGFRLLSPGTFVWLDELTEHFTRYRETVDLIDPQPGDYEISLAPPISDEVAVKIFDGFADADHEATSSRPPFQQPYQESEILRVIEALGYNAIALPKIVPGKPGVKAAVRGKLAFSVSVFDKAWERLRATGNIKDEL